MHPIPKVRFMFSAKKRIMRSHVMVYDTPTQNLPSQIKHFQFGGSGLAGVQGGRRQTHAPTPIPLFYPCRLNIHPNSNPHLPCPPTHLNMNRVIDPAPQLERAALLQGLLRHHLGWAIGSVSLRKSGILTLQTRGHVGLVILEAATYHLPQSVHK